MEVGIKTKLAWEEEEEALWVCQHNAVRALWWVAVKEPAGKKTAAARRDAATVCTTVRAAVSCAATRHAAARGRVMVRRVAAAASCVATRHAVA